MAEVINLSAARKARAKAEKRVVADQNALKFGRTKAERDHEKAIADKAKADLDGHQRE
ncbi:MAG: DUF4169 family protein [Paracoccaceae bacterium]